MAIIPQKRLFCWEEIDELGDLERLKLVIKEMPDNELMKVLEKERERGRDDYPVRPVWNSILAGVVYQHKSVESLRRELARNAQMRDMCGFDSFKGVKAIPPSWVYTRFLKKQMKHEKEVNDIFNKLVKQLGVELKDFGKDLGIDSKRLDSFALGKKKDEGDIEKKEDGRRDTDANWGKKVYKGKREDGSSWEKIISWFGYKVHIIADVKYELPVGFKVTRASASDTEQLKPMVEELNQKHTEIVERCETMSADRGYDSAENNKVLWEKYRIKPVIDIRDCWKDGEKDRPVNPEIVDNITYDFAGNIYCYCPETERKRSMTLCGFEKKRGQLKFRCPACAYGYKCKGMKKCGKGTYGEYGRIVRIPLSLDPRIFTPIARSSYKFARIYSKRTAVERINSRLDVSFGFEEHFIRGLAKMRLRVSLALIVMLTMAYGRAKQKKMELMRSLLKAA